MKKSIILTESELIKIIKNIISEEESKVLLRKLTKKSILGDEAGKYRGWTVDKLLNNDAKKLYYIYTHFEKISFVDEVLDELEEKGFPVKRITKPGIDKEQYNEYRNKGVEKFLSNLESKSVEELVKLIRARKLNNQRVGPEIYDALEKKKRKHKEVNQKERRVEKKGVMQARNHGNYRK